MAVITEPAKTFSRRFMGYDPAAVDAHIEMLTTKQQLLLDDVESLRARLKESGEEAAALRKEVAVLTDTSPVAARGATADGEDAAACGRRGFRDAGRGAGRGGGADRGGRGRGRGRAAKARRAAGGHGRAAKSPGNRVRGNQGKARGRTGRLRADAQQEREQLLADAKQEADHYREQARRAADEAIEQRIKVLEQLMGVYRDLEAVPAALESAYQELKNPPEANARCSRRTR